MSFKGRGYAVEAAVGGLLAKASGAAQMAAQAWDGLSVQGPSEAIRIRHGCCCTGPKWAIQSSQMSVREAQKHGMAAMPPLLLPPLQQLEFRDRLLPSMEVPLSNLV